MKTAKHTVKVVSYAATLNLLVISRVVALDQWNGIVGQWALMIAVVFCLELGWWIGDQIVKQTHQMMEEKQREQQLDKTP